MSRSSRSTAALFGVMAIALGAQVRGAEILTLLEAMARVRAGAHEVQAAAARVLAGDAQLREARSYRKPRVHLQEIWTRTDSPAEALDRPSRGQLTITNLPARRLSLAR
ncbi:MAG: hypothetical protein GY769_08675 [bacterium]|nr:hypothetical protein [bacterium]